MRSFKRERTCPHCGRPFVAMLQYARHVIRCEAAAQEKLDDEWFDRIKDFYRHGRGSEASR